MKKGFAIFGAIIGLLWGLLVVLLSDGPTAGSFGGFGVRAVVLCMFIAIGAAVGLVIGSVLRWVVGPIFRRK